MAGEPTECGLKLLGLKRTHLLEGTVRNPQAEPFGGGHQGRATFPPKAHLFDGSVFKTRLKLQDVPADGVLLTAGPMPSGDVTSLAGSFVELQKRLRIHRSHPTQRAQKAAKDIPSGLVAKKR